MQTLAEIMSPPGRFPGAPSRFSTLLFALIAATFVLSVGCGETESSNSADDPTVRQESLEREGNEMPGHLRGDSPNSGEEARTSENDDRSQSFLSDFDISGNSATATVLGLGNIKILPDGGFTVFPNQTQRSEVGGSEGFRFQLHSIIRDNEETVKLRSQGSLTSSNSGVSVKSESDINFYYENRTHFLKQGIICGSTCEAKKRLELIWTVPEQYLLKKDDRGVLLQAPSRETIRFSKLKVFDAEENVLTSHFKVEGGKLVYSIEVANAKFPIDIDPLVHSPSRYAAVDAPSQDNKLFGLTVQKTGDVNGNGYADVLVGQPLFTDSSQSGINHGRAFVFPGSSNGIQSTSAWSDVGITNNEKFGISLTSGDFDGDGKVDIAVGGYEWKTTVNQNTVQRGRVALYAGSNSGLATSPTTSVNGTVDGGRFGASISAGDLNCDSNDDLLVGEPNSRTPAGSNSGAAAAFFGTSSGSDIVSTSFDWRREGQDQGAVLGISVTAKADVDNSNCNEIIVGSGRDQNNRGSVFVWNSPISAASSAPAPDQTISPPAGDEGFGFTVSSAGDTNGDGIDDLAVGAILSGPTGTEGKAFLHQGSPSGLASNHSWTDVGTKGAGLGTAISSGDVNGDGISDLIVGAPTGSSNPMATSPNEEGQAFLYLGRMSNGLTSSPEWSHTFGQDSSRYGSSVAVVGNSNSMGSSGAADVAVGAARASAAPGMNAGKIFVYEAERNCQIGGTFYDKDETNPSNPCEVCSPGQDSTSWTQKSDGSSCDDGDPCTVMTTCSSGQCTGQPKDCDDGLSCTQDSCDAQDGSCEHSVTSGCAIDDQCVPDGAQQPGSPCMVCDPSVDTTSYVPSPAGTPCDDGQFCNTGEQCNSNGVCAGGSPRDCEETLPENIVACNNNFFCQEGIDTCEFTDSKSDGTTCDDGNACTSMETCQAGVCQAGSTVTCSDPGTCQSASCNPDTGMCETTNDPDGSTCDTGDACTTGSCQSGSCMTQGPVDCDDMNPCTADMCSDPAGCQNSDVPDGTEIGTPSCNENGNLLQAATCMGGEPQNPTIQDCGNYKCSSEGTPSCPTVCTEDADCKDSNFCVDDPSDSDGDMECLANRPPTADAGPDQGGYSKNERVRLDGTQSSDPDTDMLNYTWSLVDATCPQAGESADLAGLQQAINEQDQWDPNAPNPQFSAPAPDCENEELTFELEVSDGNYTVTDDTVISYGDCGTPPNAVVAGQPASADWGETISLDASNSQPGCGASLEYSWSYTPEMPELTTTQNGSSLEVTLPDVCREDNTTYTFNLTVFDGVQNSEPFDRDLFIPANGPCMGDMADAGDAGGNPSVSGSGGCSSTGQGGGPIGGLAAMLFAGGLAALRRRRRN